MAESTRNFTSKAGRMMRIPADDWRDISLLDNYVNVIGRHHGRRGPKEPIFLVVVPSAVLIKASLTYSELNITIPEDLLDIVARVPAENPIRAIERQSEGQEQPHGPLRKDVSVSKARASLFDVPIRHSPPWIRCARLLCMFLPYSVNSGYKVATPPAVIKVISAVALLQAMTLIGPITPAWVKETERCDSR
jgi:hypothetical protein